MRRLSPEEEHIVDIAEKKYGKNDRNKIFFHNGDAILSAWNNGNIIIIDLSNWAAWLAEGLDTEDELKKAI